MQKVTKKSQHTNYVFQYRLSNQSIYTFLACCWQKTKQCPVFIHVHCPVFELASLLFCIALWWCTTTNCANGLWKRITAWLALPCTALPSLHSLTLYCLGRADTAIGHTTDSIGPFQFGRLSIWVQTWVGGRKTLILIYCLHTDHTGYRFQQQKSGWSRFLG